MFTVSPWKWILSLSVFSGQVLNQTILVAQLVKNLPAMWEIRVRSLGQEDPLEKGLAVELHGQRSLAGYSPWGCKDTRISHIGILFLPL